MAQAYRIFKNNPQFEAKYNKGDVVGETYADSLLVQAKKAWDYLAAHPTPLPSVVVGPNPNPQSKYIPSGTDIVGWGGQSEYQSPYQNSNTGTPASDVDERAWAAAELYKATGLSMYSTAFDTYWSKTAPLNRIDSKQFYRNTQASLAYVTTPMHTQYPTDPVKIAAIKAAWKGVIGDPDVASGDDEYHWTYANKYRNAYRSDVDDYIGWGNYAHAAKYAFDLIIGYKLLGDARYLDAAKINLDVQLGSNPQYVSYITGVGAVPPKHPLSMTSVCLMTRATCIKDTVAPATKPMPGIPVYGPHVSMSEGYDAGRAAQDDANLYPSIHANTYPMLRRYFDIGSLVEQSEYAMANIPPLLAAYAYFSN